MNVLVNVPVNEKWPFLRRKINTKMTDPKRNSPISQATIDTQMLSALELLHYCKRFQDTLFAFCFENSAQCTAVLMDLRVLLAARIRQVIFCAADPDLTEAVETWNRAGDRFAIVVARTSELGEPAFIERVRSELDLGKAALVMLEDYSSFTASQDFNAINAVQSAVVQCAVDLGARKIFFPGEDAGLVISGKFRAYPSVQEVKKALAEEAEISIPRERLEFLLAQQELHNIDVVVVEARRGSIYEEVFTHAGSGTLFTCEYPNVLRNANESDVRDIMAIMQPYINDGSLKALSEEELLSMVRGFFVYSVNDQIIAAATLVDYGDCCEISKLCTLPRFQARGRARALVRALIDQARERGKVYVFALTVNAYVGDFFEKLGFKLIEREALPDKWRMGYDMSRASRAYFYML